MGLLLLHYYSLFPFGADKLIHPAFRGGKIRSKLCILLHLFLQELYYFQDHLKFRNNYSIILHNNNVRPFWVVKRTFFPDYYEETHIMNSPSSSLMVMPKRL